MTTLPDTEGSASNYAADDHLVTPTAPSVRPSPDGRCAFIHPPESIRCVRSAARGSATCTDHHGREHDSYSGPPSDTNTLLWALSEWIDAGNDHRDSEAVTWGRLAKIAEENGEVIEAFIGATGQNPRKGVTRTMGDVEVELLDVAVTALCALAHLRGNDPAVDVMAMFDAKVARIAKRAGLAPVAS